MPISIRLSFVLVIQDELMVGVSHSMVYQSMIGQTYIKNIVYYEIVKFVEHSAIGLYQEQIRYSCVFHGANSSMVNVNSHDSESIFFMSYLIMKI